jgi:hypothetical protein
MHMTQTEKIQEWIGAHQVDLLFKEVDEVLDYFKENVGDGVGFPVTVSLQSTTLGYDFLFEYQQDGEALEMTLSISTE